MHKHALRVYDCRGVGYEQTCLEKVIQGKPHFFKKFARGGTVSAELSTSLPREKSGANDAARTDVNLFFFYFSCFPALDSRKARKHVNGFVKNRFRVVTVQKLLLRCASNSAGLSQHEVHCLGTETRQALLSCLQIFIKFISGLGVSRRKT